MTGSARYTMSPQSIATARPASDRAATTNAITRRRAKRSNRGLRFGRLHPLLLLPVPALPLRHLLHRLFQSLRASRIRLRLLQPLDVVAALARRHGLEALARFLVL